MKNRKLILIVSLVLAMTMSLGGTLAYLTDTDADVNTMVLGNVDIEQHEYQRAKDENGVLKTETIDGINSYVLETYTNEGKVLLPAIVPNGGSANGIKWDYDQTARVRMTQVDSYGTADVFNTPNAVDKFVTVENTGKTDAYVRTFVAFEIGNATLINEKYGESQPLISSEIRAEKLADNTAGAQPWSKGFVDYVEIDGNKYLVYELIYTGANLGGDEWRHADGILPAGDTTYPSLCQVYMASWANNQEVVDLDGNANGTYDILVLSQAIQAAGWTATEDKIAAQVALDTGFGEATKENIQKWFQDDESTSELPVIFTIDSAEKLQEALDEVASGTTIVLGGNIKGDVVYTQQVDDVVIIDGNGYDFDGNIIVDGGSKQYPNAGLIIKDIDFVSEGIDMDAVINLGDGTKDTRYATNVTISGCTFDVKDAVAVKSYTGGDKNVTIENCTVSERMHSLCQLKNVEENLIVSGCIVKSARGANFNNSPDVTVKNCTFDVQKYALRFGADENTTAEDFVVMDTTLKSKNVDGDPVVEVRAGAMTNSIMSFEKVIVEGEKKYTGTENVIFTIDGVRQ